jgi:hypothetical protein
MNSKRCYVAAAGKCAKTKEIKKSMPTYQK